MPAAGDAYCCYVLRSIAPAAKATRSYTGITNNLPKRLRQHNGEIKGGARATRAGRPWKVFCLVKGFRVLQEALCFEWRAKRQRASANRKLIPVRGGLGRRCDNIVEVLSLERWTTKCRPAKEIPLTVLWYGADGGGAHWRRKSTSSTGGRSRHEQGMRA
eukprot:TRINITY_DN23228_c0_g1_i1.p2 TRINITY_DN23228_c0_g1~~TRINITY_DN23228_c0_g1_i1.p2  ORF type:complete len:160 (+),score=23.68 TRINITY_DN23228_c0_g1_i1:118-597(+)